MTYIHPRHRPCPDCGAKPGERCVTRGGKPLEDVHCTARLLDNPITPSEVTPSPQNNPEPRPTQEPNPKPIREAGDRPVERPVEEPVPPDTVSDTVSETDQETDEAAEAKAEALFASMKPVRSQPENFETTLF